MANVLEIQNLNIEFDTLRGLVQPVRGMSLTLQEGKTIGIVGESGSGKSLTSLAVMGLLPDSAKVSATALKFMGRDLLKMSEDERRKIRGGDMAMIFQDPMTSLNPSFTVGFQIKETLKVHQGGSSKQLHEKARELLGQVGIPDPESRLSNYSYQLSGGMSQRVMIAMAIACNPKLLIADEPTTALDVTIQAQILELLRKLQKEKNMSLVLITHDIGVVAEMADRIAVMYAGEVVEEASGAQIISSPRHPYTRALLNCLPGMHVETEHRSKLPSIAGLVPDLTARPRGCQYSPRCASAQNKCHIEKPEMTVSLERAYRCFYPVEGGL